MIPGFFLFMLTEAVRKHFLEKRQKNGEEYDGKGKQKRQQIMQTMLKRIHIRCKSMPELPKKTKRNRQMDRDCGCCRHPYRSDVRGRE